MSQQVEGPNKSYAVAGAIGQWLRVKNSGSGRVAIAGNEASIGVTQTAAFSTLDHITVRLRSAEGTSKVIASEAITEGNPVYAAAGGKVAASGTILEGYAQHSVTGNNSVLEIVPAHNNDVSAATGGTTAAAFLVDSDSATPKIELAAETGGTGDFKATIKPPATLTGNRVKTLQNDGDANLKDDYCFSATPDDAAGAGNSIPVGARAVNVGAVTNDANDFIVLPAIASIKIGDQIVIACNAGTNFELRTPAASNTKINDVDADGTQEYLCTDTDLVIVTKHTTTGWVAQSLTKLGAVRTAVVPD
jgi:hypothetical protein